MEDKYLILRAENPLDDCALWLTGLTVLVLLLVGVARLTSSHFIGRVMSLLTSSFRYDEVIETMQVRLMGTVNFLNFWAIFALSIVVFEIITIMGAPLPLSGLSLFGATLLGVFSFFILKFGFIWLLGFAFDAPRLVEGLITHQRIELIYISFIASIAAFIFPHIAASATKTLIIITLASLAITNVWKNIGSMKIIFANSLSYFYTFLYLCTVELIPFVLIVKALSK